MKNLTPRKQPKTQSCLTIHYLEEQEVTIKTALKGTHGRDFKPLAVFHQKHPHSHLIPILNFFEK
jgi:hypothetical protein